MHKVKTVKIPEALLNKVLQVLENEHLTFNKLVKNLLINYVREKQEVSSLVLDADLYCEKVITYLQAKKDYNRENFTEEEEKTLKIFWEIFDLIRKSPHFIENNISF